MGLAGKLALLDEASRRHAGAVTARIAVFLRRTLKPSLFTAVMRVRPQACAAYAAHLRRCGDLEGLAAFVATAKLPKVRCCVCLLACWLRSLTCLLAGLLACLLACSFLRCNRIVPERNWPLFCKVDLYSSALCF